MRLPFDVGFEVASAVRVGGGDLSEAFRVESFDGRTLFVKGAADAVEGAFAAEAAGLRWLGDATDGPAVPRVVEVAPDFLALEWVPDGGGVRDDERLGRELAALHRAGASDFGALPPGVDGGLRIGPLELPMLGTAWSDVYGSQLNWLASRAEQQGGLTAETRAAVERIGERLEDLGGPREAPARLHGDLWGGNAMGNWLIDPAAYGGHREVDLAMMRLFGGFSERVFAAYDEVFPVSDGWSDRVELWQLLPLLVHAVLFGGAYGARVEAVARAYVD